VNLEGSLPPIYFSPNSFSVYDTKQTAACLTVFYYLMLKNVKQKALALVLLTVEIKQWLPSCSA